MGPDCDLTIKFGTSGNSLAYLGGGWARSEPDFTWCLGAESHIMLPRLEPADEYIITLDVVPFVHAPELPSQRLIVSVNDAVVGSSTLSRPTLLGYRLPRSMLNAVVGPGADHTAASRRCTAEGFLRQRRRAGPVVLDFGVQRSTGVTEAADQQSKSAARPDAGAGRRTGAFPRPYRYRGMGDEAHGPDHPADRHARSNRWARTANSACSSVAAIPNRWACCGFPARSCAT